MHELSLCSSIYSIVDRAARGRPVSTIHLQVGALRQVVPETLVYCWGLVSADTPLAGSELAVESVPLHVACHECGTSSAVTDGMVRCPACGAGKVEVTTGEEFMVTSLELREA